MSKIRLDTSDEICSISGMDNDKCRIDVQLSAETYEALVEDARKNKRATRRHVEWILDRYIEAQKDDAA